MGGRAAGSSQVTVMEVPSGTAADGASVTRTPEEVRVSRAQSDTAADAYGYSCSPGLACLTLQPQFHGRISLAQRAVG